MRRLDCKRSYLETGLIGNKSEKPPETYEIS